MMEDKEIILKPRSEGISTAAARIRTGRRELRNLLARTLLRKVYAAGDSTITGPVTRAQPKRPRGVSSRQWKKRRGKGAPTPATALEYHRASLQPNPMNEERKTYEYRRRGRKDVRVRA